MQPGRNISAKEGERGIVILLVAVVLLFVVGAMAALSIDVVTFYTARSEAQLAADAAALAGARVLANSGFTSASAITAAAVEALATSVANQVATSSNVAGRALNLSEITVSYPNLGNATAFATNPHITVAVKRTDIPTFFARIWGRFTVPVQASATAEAYNPTGASALGGTVAPVAPTCVKPWVLPNLSPNGGLIISRTNGALVDKTLVGEDLSAVAALQAICTPGTCGGSWWATATPQPWQYYPGDPSSFPPPATMLPACAAGFTHPVQNSIAGCVQTPISCRNDGSNLVNLEKVHGSLRSQTAEAVNCLIHASTGGNTADTVDPLTGPIGGPNLPFQFQAGTENPLVDAGVILSNTDVMVSDSIVTVPIYDDGSLTGVPVPPVPIVGFVQVFISPNGAAVPTTLPNLGNMNTKVINIVGCGPTATGQPILGNGASPVPVRLIAGP